MYFIDSSFSFEIRVFKAYKHLLLIRNYEWLKIGCVSKQNGKKAC